MTNSVTHRRAIKTSATRLACFLLTVSLSAFAGNIPNNGPTDPSARKISENLEARLNVAASASDSSAIYAVPINSRAVSFVKNYIRSEAEMLEKVKIRGKKYFEIYDRVLSDYGLPKELKYLSVIESELTAKAVSSAGAVGPWQIMSDEAIRMGLKIRSGVDERKNFKKSTNAAAKILKELYSQFNDWPLVIAAYNCGAGRVRQAIRKSGSKNFWYLQRFLPQETRCHVKRFIGTHYFFEGSGGLTTMTAAELKRFRIKLAATGLQQSQAIEEQRCRQFLSVVNCSPMLL